MNFKNYIVEEQTKAQEARDKMIANLEKRMPAIFNHVKIGNTTEDEFMKIIKSELMQVCSRTEIETAKDYVERWKTGLRDMIDACKVPQDVAHRITEYMLKRGM